MILLQFTNSFFQNYFYLNISSDKNEILENALHQELGIWNRMGINRFIARLGLNHYRLNISNKFSRVF